MLGTALACASLLMAVGGVGVSSMLPTRNVALPSISSITKDGDYVGGIRPVDEEFDFTDSIDYGSPGAVRVGFDGETVTYSVVDTFNFVFGIIYTDDRVLNVDEVVEFNSAVGDPCIFCFLYDTTQGYIINLPDLTYWERGSNGWRIYVTWCADMEENVGYYGRVPVSGFHLEPITPAELGADVNPISAIADGLGVIPALGGGLTDGFDAVFVDNGALTAVGTFAFLLMGIGISVGIVKKCFNWVTGRHGM